MAIDFAALAARLLSQSRGLLAEWYPAGKLHGHEFCIGDVLGAEGESCKVNVNTGAWKDFATGQAGGDLISLYAAREGLTQAEAARKLNGDSTIATRVTHAPPPVENKPKWTPIIPVPVDAPAPPDDYYRKGGVDAKGNTEWHKLRFVARWTYTDHDGAVLGHVVRFEWFEHNETRKDIVPQVYCEGDGGKRQWRWRSLPQPRPLYNLRALRDRPDAPVVVVEGEKKVEAARILMPQYVAVCWPGGASAWRKTDWSPLKGRSVLCWPDADKQTVKTERQAKDLKLEIGALIPQEMQPGMRAMWEIGHHLLKQCPVVKVIVYDINGAEPDGWDVADAVRDGWDWQRVKEWALPRVVNLSEGGGNAKIGRGNPSGIDRQREGGDVQQRGAGRRSGTAERDGGHAASDRAAQEVVSQGAAVDQTATAGRGDADEREAGDGDGGRADQAGGGAREPDQRAARGSRGADAGDQTPAPSTGRRERLDDEGGALHRAHEDSRPARQLRPQAPAASDATPSSQVGRWLAWGLERNGNGAALTNLNNAVRVMESDPALRGIVWFDSFLQRFMTGEPAREWTDADDINLALYMQREVGLSKMGRDTVCQAVISVGMRDKRHCVCDWLASLEWDGTPRIESMMSRVFGADDTPYVRAVSRNFMIGLVARAFEPGCKQDNIVVLEGAQGLYKSSALLALVGAQWYSEQHESATNVKAFAEILQGKWLIEVSEMDSFSRADVNRVKQVASCQADRYRDSYARYASDHPRQCSMLCTVNGDTWNRDETGARRFWPIVCKGKADLAYIRSHRAQLFAEAVAVYLKAPVRCETEVRMAAGAAWWVVPEAEATIEQRKRYDADPWLGPISHHVTGLTSTTVNEIAMACLRIEIKDLDRSRQMRIASCLRALGWVNGGNKRRGGTVVKVWEPSGDVYGEKRPEPEEAKKDATHQDDIPFS